jgi:hypothetical protein
VPMIIFNKILRAPATATPNPTPLNTAVGNYRWMDKKTVRTVNNDSSMDDVPSAQLSALRYI